MTTRYWLRMLDLPWQEVTRDQFVRAESGSGFHAKPGCGDLATGGFVSGVITGRIISGDNNPNDEGGKQ